MSIEDSKASFFSGGENMNQHKEYSIFTIADWFLHKTICDQKKLQKLCYYAQAWNLALRKHRLINADFEAWVHGPVNADLWHVCHDKGFEDLPEEYLSRFVSEVIAEDDEDFLIRVLNTYGKFSGYDLECMSHVEKPWILAREGYGEAEICHTIISDASMQEYYYSLTSGEGVGG